MSKRTIYSRFREIVSKYPENTAIIEELPSPDNPSGKCAYLMNIYVREAFRNTIINIMFNYRNA